MTDHGIPAPPPRWQDVAQLALTHPVVYRALSRHHAGDLTRVEALSVMVLALAEELSDTHEHVARLLETRPAPTSLGSHP